MAVDAEAAKRMKAGKPSDPTSNLDGGSGESIEQAAKSLGVSTTSAKRAKTVARHDPELAEKVRAGDERCPLHPAAPRCSSNLR